MVEIKPIAPSIEQLIIRDLGAYGGLRSGVDKLYYLMSAIYNLQSFIVINYGEEIFLNEVQKELEKVKKFTRFKDWNEINQAFNKIRPILNEIKMLYDNIRDKELKGKKDTPFQLKYKKLSRKVSPYQMEIYFVFNVLMKISGVQRKTIPNEAWRTPELREYIKMPFEKQKQRFSDSPETKNV